MQGLTLLQGRTDTSPGVLLSGSCSSWCNPCLWGQTSWNKEIASGLCNSEGWGCPGQLP